MNDNQNMRNDSKSNETHFAHLKLILKYITQKTKIIMLADDTVTLKHSLFIGLALFSIIACGPLLIYGSILFLKDGNFIAAIIEILAYLLLVTVAFIKSYKAQTRSFLIVLILYFFSIALLIYTGNKGAGLVCIIAIMFLSGIVLDSKKLIGFILTDIFAFAIITYLLLSGKFNGYEIVSYEGIWLINMLTTQVSGIGLMFLIHIIYNVLENRNYDLIKSQSMLQQSEERKSLILANVSGIVYNCSNDKARIMEYVSEGCYELTGYKAESIIQNNDIVFCELILEEYRDKVCNEWCKIVNNHSIYKFEYPIRTEKGQIKWVIDQGKCINDENGELQSIEGIIIDITDRRQKQELIREKELAETATKAKSDFLANMSHEIRTPMNAVIGLNKLMKHTDLNNKQSDYVNKIDSSASHLLNLINNILDFSKVEAGKITFESIEFDLYDVISEQFDILSIKAFEKGIDLILDIDVNIPCKLIGDPYKLGQILCNLMSNAIKFTEEGHVLLKVYEFNKSSKKVCLKFNIIDTGIGMSSEQSNKIFNPFSQGDKTTTRKFGGTGLGLTISKQFIELMGGAIKVSSAIDEGSDFEFLLEYNLDFKKDVKQYTNLGIRALVIEDNEIRSNIISKYLTYLGVENTQVLLSSSYDNNISVYEYDIIITSIYNQNLKNILSSEEEKYKYSELPKLLFIQDLNEDLIINEDIKMKHSLIQQPIYIYSLYKSILELLELKSDNNINGNESNNIVINEINNRNIKILIVEDNDINMLVLKEVLLNLGYNVDEAVNGKEAIESINSENYNIILMDIQMPILDGFEATKIIREKYTKKELPIIALTADVLAETKNKVFAIGMNDYLSKPIDNDQLQARIRKWAN